MKMLNAYQAMLLLRNYYYIFSFSCFKQLCTKVHKLCKGLKKLDFTIHEEYVIYSPQALVAPLQKPQPGYKFCRPLCIKSNYYLNVHALNYVDLAVLIVVMNFN